MDTLEVELSGVELGPPAQFRNLTIFPMLRPAPSKPEPDYYLLEEAIGLGVARVTELPSGGSVPELCFSNMSDRPVLLLDGEELIGAKQNRVLNLSVLVGAKQTLGIPVSCVEAGRWRMTSLEFQPAQHFMYASGRARRATHVTESLRTTGSRASHQGEVWEEIAEKSERMDSRSPTGAMHAMYERHGLSLEQFVRAFSWQERQAGVLFSLGGRIFGFDLLDHATSMRTLFPKLIGSYALDALDQALMTEDCPPSLTADEASAFIRQVGQAAAFSEPALGMGKDFRLVDQQVSGAALWADGRYVHCCAFSQAAPPANRRFRTRMSRPSGRSGSHDA